jgi:hypothetical protein
MREVGSRLQTNRAPACPGCVPPPIGLTRFGAHFTDPIKSPIRSRQPVQKEVWPLSPDPGNGSRPGRATRRRRGKLLGPATGSMPAGDGPLGNGKLDGARLSKIPQSRRGEYPPEPSLPLGSRTRPCAETSVVPRCPPIRPPEVVDSRGAGGIVSSQGRSFSTPALGPCREPGGQLGASTPRLAPFSYRTAAKGWTSSLCPRQGRARRADEPLAVGGQLSGGMERSGVSATSRNSPVGLGSVGC